MKKSFDIGFPNAKSAKAGKVQQLVNLKDVLNELELCSGQPTILLVGGAGGLDEAAMEKMRSFFNEILAPFADELGAYVIDGGTDAGVMKLMGQAKAEICGTFKLIGVAAIGTVKFAGNTPVNPQSSELEQNHDCFILVPGSDWGDESIWLDRVTKSLSEGSTSVTILINGGDIARKDLDHSLVSERAILVMQGTGRLADEIANKKKRPDLIEVAKLEDKATNVKSTLNRLLKSGEVNKYDEYKFFAESTQFLTKRRQSANQMYLSVNTAIFAVIAILIKDVRLEGFRLVFVSLPLILVGLLVCWTWFKMIKQYKALINWRYHQLMGMEKTLKHSHHVYIKEWADLYKPLQGKEKFGFSKLESWLPQLFGGLYIIYESGLILNVVIRFMINLIRSFIAL